MSEERPVQHGIASPQHARHMEELGHVLMDRKREEKGLSGDQDHNLFDLSIRRAARIAVLVGGALFGASYLIGVYYTMNGEAWAIQIAHDHFAATVGLPFAALAALCLVFILEINAGKVQIRGMGFEFRGATGPIIMWMACFMVIAFAIKMIWPLG